MYYAADLKNVKKLIATASALAVSSFVMLNLTAIAGRAEDDDDNAHANAQVAEIYRLQAAFHGAASGAGVSPAVKRQHLIEMLALWTDDATLVVGSTTYMTKGEPGTASCAAGSLTLCDFFENHAGSFRLDPPRDWVSLAPSFLTRIAVHGNTADLYFECHYFDVPTGLKKSDVSFGLRGIPDTGQARKVHGHWLLSYGVVGFPPLSAS